MYYHCFGNRNETNRRFFVFFVLFLLILITLKRRRNVYVLEESVVNSQPHPIRVLLFKRKGNFENTQRICVRFVSDFEMLKDEPHCETRSNVDFNRWQSTKQPTAAAL